jgi:predicted metal-dependent hydrolase
VEKGEIRLARRWVEETSIKQQLETFYRSQAREHVERLVASYASCIDGEPGKIYIRNQTTKWGSCSGKDNLNFNWRLVMAPPAVLEYVVVHELVHLEHRNHSEAFWNRLEELLPSYEEQKTWLEENALKLVFARGDLR